MTSSPDSSRRNLLDDASDFDVERYRNDFPILQQPINSHPLVYLDNAATSQKPQAVLDAVRQFYTTENANIHRGVHQLSVRATQAYEQTRMKARDFIGARDVEEIIFVRGATEAINLVAQSFGRSTLVAGDEILITEMEHHSNIVPWQMLCEQMGTSLRVAPISDEGELIIEEFDRLLGPRTRLVAVTHVSNAIGTINPVGEITRRSHERGARVLVDGAQAVPHMKVDVTELDCDFYVLSSHKVYGPTGVGVLYGKRDLLEAMPPYQGGGEMIRTVTFEKTTYNDLPHRFEAGTPNIAGTVAFGAAIDYLGDVGLDAISTYEQGLTAYATEVLEASPRVRLIGTARRKAAVLSFVLEGIDPHHVGTILDQQGIAIRTGHHCAQPLMDRFDVPATCRVSMGFYNTRKEIDTLAASLRQIAAVFE